MRTALIRASSNGWLGYAMYRLCEEFNRCIFGPIEWTTILNSNSYAQFETKDVLFSILGLQSIKDRIVPGEVIRVPERPDVGNDPYFPQVAIVWEQVIDDYTVEGKTLLLEIGSGFRTVSLKFIQDPRRSGKPVMQLDHLCVYHGHDYTELDIEHLDASPSIQRFICQVGSIVELILLNCGEGVDAPLEALVSDVQKLQKNLLSAERTPEADDNQSCTPL